MLDKLKQRLKDSGQSVTSQRVAVFEFLDAHDPTTVAEVISGLPGLDRASIYRALSLFRELGIIQDIVTGGRRMIELTDGFDRHHHHLSCLKCGAIQTIEDPAIEEGLDQLARRHGYEPVSHQIEVTGLCPKCRQAAGS